MHRHRARDINREIMSSAAAPPPRSQLGWCDMTVPGGCVTPKARAGRDGDTFRDILTTNASCFTQPHDCTDAMYTPVDYLYI